MQYGFFDDAAKEYVITTPETPLPWINYLGNEDFFGLISNTGGGYAFFQDARLQRLTRFRYNNVPADQGGRYYYIREAGQPAWNPGWLPTKTPLDHYVCRHGLGYTVFESEKKQLKSQLTCFVPMGETCEIHHLALTNASAQTKAITLHSMVEWCLWDAVDDSQNFQRILNVAEVEVDGNVIYHKTEYRERRSHYAYFGVNTDVAGFDTDRDAFLGPFRGFSEPLAVENGRSADSIAHGWYPIGSHQLDVSLAPGETRELVFILGYAANPADEKWAGRDVINKSQARRVMAKFHSPDQVRLELDQLKGYWTDLLTAFQLESPDRQVDRMVNIWNQYQCMVTFNLSRSASYFESGTGRGIGFRDGNQDLLGFLHLIPAKARQRILDLAAIQLKDGSTYHQFQPLTKKGNDTAGRGFNDDPLWLIASAAAYIRETGDQSILDEAIPFADGPDQASPLFEHLRRSLRYTMDHLGPHGLPLIGRADWNDCLNLNCFSTEPGESFQTTAHYESGIAESVFIAGMFVLYGREYAELCQRFGSSAEADEIRRQTDRMEDRVLEHGWDGKWFLRAYDAIGGKVGSQENEEGRIYIESQGMCVMAGIGLPGGHARQALDSVEELLVSSHGIELVAPPYTRYRPELGEITSYPPGYKENGSVFCHNNPWITIAQTRLGQGTAAFATYRRISPAYSEPFSEIHKTEPYIYSQTIAGRASAAPGEAKNSWLTGTAAWSFVSITQAILGIQPDFDGLRIKPCLPEHIRAYTVRRRFRGCLYSIEVADAGLGSVQISVDGKPVPGNLIPLQSASECQVRVRL